MKEDLTLFNRPYHSLCQAVERGGVICFGKKVSKGLCGKHYARWLRHGDYNIVLIERTSNNAHNNKQMD